MEDDGRAAIQARLEAGRQQRRRRQRISKRLTLTALVVLLISVAVVPTETDWLRALLLAVVVALNLAAAVVVSRGDEAARVRLAKVSMWVLVLLGVSMFSVAVGYSLVDEPIPADLVGVGPLLAGMLVLIFADVSSSSDPEPTVWDEWESRTRR